MHQLTHYVCHGFNPPAGFRVTSAFAEAASKPVLNAGRVALRLQNEI
jgi:hypothetical protein